MNIKSVLTVAAAAVFSVATFSALAKERIQFNGGSINSDGSVTLNLKTRTVNPKSFKGHHIKINGVSYKVKKVSSCQPGNTAMMTLKAPNGERFERTVHLGSHKCTDALGH